MLLITMMDRTVVKVLLFLNIDPSHCWMTEILFLLTYLVGMLLITMMERTVVKVLLLLNTVLVMIVMTIGMTILFLPIVKEI